MVAAMIELSRSLNFRVVAEQVEDSAALEAARRMGIDFLQGFAIGTPRPAAARRPERQRTSSGPITALRGAW